ncbi:hypothetical protein ACFLSZ_05285 [Candidatus Bipolaricaulota bacterium]
MSIFWTLMSAISTVSLNFITKCPKCSAKMRREEMHEQVYTRTKRARFASTARPTSTFNTEVGRRAVLQVQVVPVFDICTECGHRIRRKNMKLG